MIRLIDLFPTRKRTKNKLIRQLRRLVYQRNYWRNRTNELRARRKR